MSGSRSYVAAAFNARPFGMPVPPNWFAVAAVVLLGAFVNPGLWLIGAGLEGDRVVGELDENYYGMPVDPGSGDVNEDGQVLSAEAVGATLLALADVDPAEHVSGVQPLTGVIA